MLLRPLILIAAVASCWSASFDPSLVPSDQQWLVNIDVRTLMQGKIGEYIRTRIAADPENKPKLELFATITGTNALTDIDGITAAGMAGDNTATAVWLSGRFDAAKLTTLAESAKDHLTSSYSGKAIHQWTDQDKQRTNYGCLVRDNLLIIAEGEKAMQNAIDVANGLHGGLGSDSELVKALPDMSSPFLVAGVAGIDGWKKAQIDSKIAKGMKFVGLSAGETGDSLAASVRVIALDAATAADLRNVIQGLISLGSLSNNADIADLVKRVNVNLSEDTVLLNLSIPLAQVQNAADKQLQAAGK